MVFGVVLIEPCPEVVLSLEADLAGPIPLVGGLEVIPDGLAPCRMLRWLVEPPQIEAQHTPIRMRFQPLLVARLVF
jgi:hypothetical protein